MVGWKAQKIRSSTFRASLASDLPVHYATSRLVHLLVMLPDEMSPIDQDGARKEPASR